MTTFIQMEKRTIYGILKTKYLDHVEKEGVYPTIKIFLIWFWSFMGALVWSYPDTFGKMVGIILQMWNFIIPKTVTVLFIFLALPTVFEEIRGEISEKVKKDDTAKIWGVSVVEIVWYIFEHGDFVRSQVMENFAISRSDYSEIVDLLDKNNILIRWENNSRVLNPGMTREIIANILMGKDENKYGEIIGDRHNFFDNLKGRITSLLSSEKEERWKKTKIRQTASES